MAGENQSIGLVFKTLSFTARAAARLAGFLLPAFSNEEIDRMNTCNNARKIKAFHREPLPE